LVSLYYIDTSAALKLLVEESHSKAFAGFYDEAVGATWVSSALLRIEVMRAVTRVFPALLPDARDLLLAFDFLSIDDDIVDAAMNEPDRMLRSLDAIHLATARVLGTDLTGLATYDDRLAVAGKDAGFEIVSPRG
jgi:predicted nucleic acid-binding protein